MVMWKFGIKKGNRGAKLGNFLLCLDANCAETKSSSIDWRDESRGVEKIQFVNSKPLVIIWSCEVRELMAQSSALK